jgi:hypothetical protein
MKYSFLTLNDLQLGLGDLVERRLPKVTGVHSVSAYAPRLKARHAELSALPGATGEGEPFAAEIAAKDAEHDGYGGAVWYLVEACQRAPSVSAEHKAALEEVRKRFVPELAELKRPHADEAAAAARRAPDLEALKKSLRSFAVPGGGSLYDWCAAFLSAGRDLDVLLRKRADVVTADRSGVAGLRASTVGLLNRLRTAVADELDGDADALARADHALFAYFDELEARRAPAVTPAAEAPPAPTPAPVG